MKRKIWNKRGEGTVEHSFGVILAFFVIAFFLAVAPAYIKQQSLNTFANELCRTAEMTGCIGEATDERTQELEQQTGLSPDINWSGNGNFQLGSDITVTLRTTADIGFGGLGHFPVTLNAKASGKSEVYHK